MSTQTTISMPVRLRGRVAVLVVAVIAAAVIAAVVIALAAGSQTHTSSTTMTPKDRSYVQGITALTREQQSAAFGTGR